MVLKKMAKISKKVSMLGDDDPFSRYQRHHLIIKQEGSGNGKVSVLINLDSIAKDLGRKSKQIVSFLSKLNATSYQQKNKCYYLRGHFEESFLNNQIQLFINKFILCKTCGNPETTDEIESVCLACGSLNKFQQL